MIITQKNIIILLLFSIMHFPALSQVANDSGNKQFNIFIKQGSYGPDVADFVKGRSNIHYYKFMSHYYIDRDNKNIVDYRYVNEGIVKMFPNVKDAGFLCLDIENTYYKDIKNFSKGTPRFKAGMDALVQLVKYVKERRPNVKVGLYGLPHNFYWFFQKSKISRIDLDPIFEVVDYISPSLYIHYPDDERGVNANLEYLGENLDLALRYGKKFSKPVIPYVWYVVHPGNKKHGYEYISPEKMTTYLNFIKNYSSLGVRSNGVIWWEPSKLNIKGMGKNLKNKGDLTKESILLKNLNNLKN